MIKQRINGENLKELVHEKVVELSAAGAREIQLAELYAALRELRWDIDDNDIRCALSKLFADKRVLLTFNRRLRSVNGHNGAHAPNPSD